MKFDEKKRKRLADTLDSITPEEMVKNKTTWLPVSETAKKEGITIQRVLQKIKEGKYVARAIWGVLIVVKQNSQSKGKENVA